MNVIDIYVRYSSGAYVTNTMNRERSSATMSSGAAAQRQAEKLFGPALQSVVLVDDNGSGASVWRATADADVFAFCWATGLIQFGTVVPETACHFATGPDRALRARLDVVARHGQGRSTGELLVPGVPEARSQKKGMDALLAWEAQCAKRNRAKNSYCVMFGPECRWESVGVCGV